jgi:hypothetical protein
VEIFDRLTFSNLLSVEQDKVIVIAILLGLLVVFGISLLYGSFTVSLDILG